MFEIVAGLLTVTTICFVLAYLVTRTIILVPAGKRAIVMRGHKYYRTLHPGYNFIMPFLTTPCHIHWTRAYDGKLLKYDSIYIPKVPVAQHGQISVGLDKSLCVQVAFSSYVQSAQKVVGTGDDGWQACQDLVCQQARIIVKKALSDANIGGDEIEVLLGQARLLRKQKRRLSGILRAAVAETHVAKLVKTCGMKIVIKSVRIDWIRLPSDIAGDALQSETTNEIALFRMKSNDEILDAQFKMDLARELQIVHEGMKLFRDNPQLTIEWRRAMGKAFGAVQMMPPNEAEDDDDDDEEEVK